MCLAIKRTNGLLFLFLSLLNCKYSSSRYKPCSQFVCLEKSKSEFFISNCTSRDIVNSLSTISEKVFTLSCDISAKYSLNNILIDKALSLEQSIF